MINNMRAFAMGTDKIIKVTTTVGRNGIRVEDTEYDSYIIRKLTVTSELDGTTHDIKTIIEKGGK
tara:strand:+ start:150 stop:344 length:195 start_codon:yes stop_codon:yes gene_type:complete